MEVTRIAFLIPQTFDLGSSDTDQTGDFDLTPRKFPEYSLQETHVESTKRVNKYFGHIWS